VAGSERTNIAGHYLALLEGSAGNIVAVVRAFTDEMSAATADQASAAGFLDGLTRRSLSGDGRALDGYCSGCGSSPWVKPVETRLSLVSSVRNRRGPSVR
jgi:hypothetical protein